MDGTAQDEGRARSLAVVTGASSGIGLELAKLLADEGFDLVLAAEDDGIQAAAAAVRASGADATAVQADLATAEGVEELAAAVHAVGRGVDVVVVNAGVGVGGPFVDSDLDAQLNLIDLNVRGAVHLTRLVLPGMVERGEGRLLFTSSIAATHPGPYEATYAASKAYLSSFGQALRTELADTGVTVTLLMPGPTETEFFVRAGLEDTKIGQSDKDDPAEVARDGYEAMMAGKDHVVAGSAQNRAMTGAAKVLPDRASAAAHAKMSAPGSGEG